MGDDDRRWVNERAAFLSERKRSANTRALYEIDIRRFEAWCDSLGYRPLDIDSAQLFEFHQHLGKSLSVATVSHQMGVIRQLYDFLVHRNIVPRNPARDISWESPRFTPREVPDVAQLRRIWESCKTDDERVVVGLLGLCGLKPNELCDAQVRDLDRVDEIDLLKIPARQNPHQRPYVALCPPLARVTAHVASTRSSGPLARTRWDTQFDRHSLRKLTRRVGERAGLDFALNPLHLSYCLRAIGIAHGFAYGEMVRSIGEMEARRLSAWVERIPGSVDDHPALRLGRMVLGSGSASLHNLLLAAEILRTTDAHPAAALAYAGATVEHHLRHLSLQRGLALPSSPKLSAYGSVLMQHRVIDNRALQLLNRMQDLRNAAAHGRFEDVEASDAVWFLENARSLFETYPVVEASAPAAV